MKKKFNPKTARFYYLNADWSQGVSIDDKGRRETLKFQAEIDGPVVERSVVYHQTLGNFSLPYIRVKGKVEAVYPSDKDETVFQTFETRYPGEAI